MTNYESQPESEYGKVERAIKKSKAQLATEYPWIGCLIDGLNIKVLDKKELEDLDDTSVNSKELLLAERIPLAGIDQKGNVYFKKEKMLEEAFKEENNRLKPDFQMIHGILFHESLHMVHKGMIRGEEKNQNLWNIAQDAIINNTVIKQGFTIPEWGVIPEDPDGKMIFEVKGGENIIIEDISNESFESIYRTLKREIDKRDLKNNNNNSDNNSSGNTSGEGSGKTSSTDMSDNIESNVHDIPLENDDLTEEEKEEIEEKWEKKKVNASQLHRKTAGDTEGFEEEVAEKKRKKKRRYPIILQESINSIKPIDEDWVDMDQRYLSSGTKLPGDKHGKSKVFVAIDTSASILTEQLNEFLGEIINILETEPNISLTIIQHDVAVKDIKEYKNPRKSDFNKLEIKGRGGTRHYDVFNKVNEKTKGGQDFVLICFTDGHSKIPDNPPFRKSKLIWALTEDGTNNMPYGKEMRI